MRNKSQIDKQSQNKPLDPIEKIIVVETLNTVSEDFKAKSENLNLNPQDNAALAEKALIEASINLLSLPYDPNKSSILTQQQEAAGQSKEAADKFSGELRDIYISKFMSIERRIEYLRHILRPAIFDLLEAELREKKHHKNEQEEALYEELLEEFKQKEFAEQHQGDSHNIDDAIKENQEFHLYMENLCKDFDHEKDDPIEFLNNLSNDQQNTKQLLWAIHEFKKIVNNKQAKIGENLGDNKTHIHSNKLIASLCALAETDQKNLMVKIHEFERRLMKSHIEQKSSKEQTVVNKADIIQQEIMKVREALHASTIPVINVESNVKKLMYNNPNTTKGMQKY